jgi:hypothetical protein
MYFLFIYFKDGSLLNQRFFTGGLQYELSAINSLKHMRHFSQLKKSRLTKAA